MVLMTMIARVADGLPLAASVQEDEQSGRSLMDYQNQAKQFFRKISGDNTAPARQTLETGPYLFHYLIERGVCYLVLCEKAFSKRLAFSYLEELQSEFSSQHGKKVETVSRPYHFIAFVDLVLGKSSIGSYTLLKVDVCVCDEFSSQHGKKVETVSRPYHFIAFDTFIQKTRKLYMDSRARKNLSNINTELQDVQRIMVQNIDDVLQRGEALNTLGNKASNLSMLSQQYKKDATYLNLRSTYAKVAAVLIVVVVLFLFLRW